MNIIVILKSIIITQSLKSTSLWNYTNECSLYSAHSRAIAAFKIYPEGCPGYVYGRYPSF